MKLQVPNNKSQANNNKTNHKAYDLEERTLDFSKLTIQFCTKLPKTVITVKIIDQLIRSSTSIGANYREANDAVSKKDFKHRLYIARKEAKETSYWLELIDATDIRNIEELLRLKDECIQLRNILSSIIKKQQKSK